MRQKIEAVLSSIMNLLDTEEGASDEAIAALVAELYDSAVDKYRPVVRAFPSVADKVAGDVTPIAITVMKLVNTISANPELQQEMDTGNILKAERRFKALNAYQAAGFKRDEAMSLMLADIVSLKESFKKVSRSARSSSSSKG